MALKISVCILSAVLLMTTACSKDPTEPIDTTTITTVTGQLWNSGSPATDGIGYILVPDNQVSLAVENPPDSLQLSVGTRIRVEAAFTYTGTRSGTMCSSCAGPEVVRLVSLRKL